RAQAPGPIPSRGGQVNTYVPRSQFQPGNRLQRMTYPDNPNGEVVRYTYDSGGLVSRVVGNDDALETAYAARVDYDKFGQRVLLDIGNGTRTTYAYDEQNRRLKSVRAT